MNQNWEAFEEDCVSFLNENYSSNNLSFLHEGGSNSTTSDIAVTYKGTAIFYIEAKSPNSQCGQFVLIPDKEKKAFIYSQRNKSKLNQFSQEIILEMEKNFDFYANIDNKNHPLPDKPQLYSKWIINYYKEKGVKFFITKNRNSFIIFPPEKLLQYFNVSATYRVKKSGSSNPNQKDFSHIKFYLTQKYPASTIEQVNGKTQITNYAEGKQKYKIRGSEYFFSPIDDNNAYIKKLSNTCNSNVIFSISIKMDIDNTTDMQEFLELIYPLKN